MGGPELKSMKPPTLDTRAAGRAACCRVGCPLVPTLPRAGGPAPSFAG